MDVHEPGTTLQRWTLVRELGQGGMGSVWLAESGGVQVALKTLHPHLARTSSALARFAREASLGGSLSHPGLIPVLETGSTDGVPWMAMEFVNGESLEDRLDRAGRVEEDTARALLAEVADALVELHDHGIIHRDIKPGNLIWDTVHERTRILDLGIARQDDRTALTSTGHFVGSTRYAAPEQFEPGRPEMDGRVDLYALGVVLYELVTGESAFHGMSVPALYLAKSRNVLPSPSNLVDGVTTELDDLVAWLTATDPDARPSSAREAAKALRATLAIPTSTNRAAATGSYEELPPSNVPILAQPAIGRAGQARALVNHIQAGRAVTLMGVAGSGKTRLAIEAAHVARPSWAGGTVWVEAEPVTTANGLLGLLAKALQLPPTTTLSDSVLHALRSRPNTLVVLDNLEQIPDAREVVATCVEGQAAVLATSRMPIGLAKHELLELVEPLAPPEVGAQEPRDVMLSPAVALFLERARQVDRGFELNDRNAAAIAELIRHLDGLPLAIELAASRAAMISPAKMLARVEHRFRLLRDRGATGRHAALEAAIDTSWQLLAPPEQAALAWASLFRGPFDVEDADAVWPVWDVFPNADDALDLLQELLHHNLVKRHVAADGHVRFSLLRSVRAFANLKLKAPVAIPDAPTATGPAAVQGLTERWTEHLIGRASADLSTWHQTESPQAMDALSDRLFDYLAALPHDTSPSRSCAAACLVVIRRRGPLSALTELTQHIDQAPAAVRMDLGRAQLLASDLPGATSTFTALLDSTSRWAALAFRGLTAFQQGNVDAAVVDLQTVLDAAEAPIVDRVRALNHLGKVCISTGDVDRAQRCFDEAVEHLPTLSQALASAVHNNRGMLALRRGDLARAQRSFEESLRHDRHLRARLREGKVLTNLGIVAYHRGRPDQSLTIWKQALICHRAVGNPESESAVLGNLGALMIEQGELEKAAHYCEASIRLKRLLGQPQAEAHGMANLAKVAVARGQVHQAEHVCNQALALLADTECRALRAILLWQRGEARLAMACDDDGLDDLEHAVQHAEASGNKGLTTILLTRQVEAFASRGSLDAAHAALERAQAVCPHSERALVAVANGALQVARGDPDLAKVSLQTARNHTQDTQAGPGSPLALAMARLSAALLA